LSAKGLTTWEISAHFAEVYGATVSKNTISRITDTVTEEMQVWSNRPLARVHATVFSDAVIVKIRDRRVGNCPVHAAIGSTWTEQDILRMWASDRESAKFWMAVLTHLKNRGVADVFLVVCDGLKGPPNSVRDLACEVHDPVIVTVPFAARCPGQSRGSDTDLLVVGTGQLGVGHGRGDPLGTHNEAVDDAGERPDQSVAGRGGLRGYSLITEDLRTGQRATAYGRDRRDTDLPIWKITTTDVGAADRVTGTVDDMHPDLMGLRQGDSHTCAEFAPREPTGSNSRPWSDTREVLASTPSLLNGRQNRVGRVCLGPAFTVPLPPGQGWSNCQAMNGRLGRSTCSTSLEIATTSHRARASGPSRSGASPHDGLPPSVRASHPGTVTEHGCN
jgi:hypothetical protein